MVQNEPGFKVSELQLTGIAGSKLEPVNTPGWMRPPEKQKKNPIKWADGPGEAGGRGAGNKETRY